MKRILAALLGVWLVAIFLAPVLAVGDTDGDGLLDIDELYIYGTSPNLWDTDYDGCSDGAEVLVHYTNPLDSQSYALCCGGGAPA